MFISLETGREGGGRKEHSWAYIQSKADTGSVSYECSRLNATVQG